MQVESSIQKESWYREVESLRLFKPAPPTDLETPFSEWAMGQYERYRKYLGLPKDLHLPTEELVPIINKLKTWWAEKREELRNNIRLEKDRKRKNRYRARHIDKIREIDRERNREKSRITYESLSPQERYERNQRSRRKRTTLPTEVTDPQKKERRKRNYEEHKRRMLEDPSYALEYREKSKGAKERGRKRQYEEHKRRMLEDPDYASEYRERMKNLNVEYRRRKKENVT